MEALLPALIIAWLVGYNVKGRTEDRVRRERNAAQPGVMRWDGPEIEMHGTVVGVAVGGALFVVLGGLTLIVILGAS